MIERYARAPMLELWSESNKYQTWLEVEIAALRGWAAAGLFPEAVAEHVARHAVIDEARILEIEAVTRHDVAAFVQAIEERVGVEHGRWIHFGLTSSDVLDTSLAMRLRQAGQLLLDGIDALLDAIRTRAREHAMTPMIGRSHGIHAELTTLGHMFATWYDQLSRDRLRMEQAIAQISVAKISGAVGTFANVPPEVEATVCALLDLSPEPASTQIVSRDRHAQFFAALAMVATSIEKFATQIRHMQRTEVGELEEYFATGQKGSSAMPHKRNPVLSENLCGLARLVRAALLPALENVPLWHERDISHSSVERVNAPDATTLLDFMLSRTTRLVSQLVIYPEKMQRNIDRTHNLPYSQRVLLELIKVGESRQDAYSLVQKLAMKAWEEELDFARLVRDDQAITQRLDNETIAACFSQAEALRHIPTILARVFGEDFSSDAATA